MGGIDHAELSGISKMFLAFMMWVGRLEVVLALLLFTRTFWSDVISDARSGLYNMRSKKN
jgi:trk system potassium uptake protein TrkH